MALKSNVKGVSSEKVDHILCVLSPCIPPSLAWSNKAKWFHPSRTCYAHHLFSLLLLTEIFFFFFSHLDHSFPSFLVCVISVGAASLQNPGTGIWARHGLTWEHLPGFNILFRVPPCSSKLCWSTKKRETVTLQVLSTEGIANLCAILATLLIESSWKWSWQKGYENREVSKKYHVSGHIEPQLTLVWNTLTSLVCE